jgi:hypothetical protein
MTTQARQTGSCFFVVIIFLWDAARLDKRHFAATRNQRRIVFMVAQSNATPLFPP